MKNYLKKIRFRTIRNSVLILFATTLILSIGTYYLSTKTPAAQAAWYATSGWSYRKAFVIDSSKVSGTTNLTNFPILISRIDSELIKYAQTDGDDILFTSADGTTKLDHEIESYNSTTGEITAWVEIPTLDYDDDTTIFMYYGNTSASSQQNVSGTWNNNYLAVWHLNETVTDESTSGTHTDSTNPAENGTQNNNDEVTGKIAKAQDFDNTADYINVGDDADLDFASGADFSFSAWVNLDATGSSEMIMAKKNGTGGAALGYLFRIDSTGALRLDMADTQTDQYNRISTTNVTAGSWTHVGFVFDDASEANTKIFINGSATGETDDGSSDLITDIDDMTNALSFRLGAESDAGNPFHGSIDEARMVNGVLSDDWVAAEYNNQSDPSSFFKSISSPQAESAVNPNITYSMSEGYGNILNSTGTDNYPGTISGASWQREDLCLNSKCLYFDGTNDVVTTSGTVSNVRSVAFWVRPMTTTEQLVDLNGSAYIQSSSGTISATGFTSPTIYVNGKVSSTLVANRWQHVIVTTATGISASSIKLAQISTNYGQLFMDEFQLYTSQLSSSQVISLFNSRGANLTNVNQGSLDQKVTSDGLIGYWQLDHSSGDASDSSGNALTLTNNGTTTYGSGKFGSGSEHVPASSQFFSVVSALSNIQTLSFWVNPDTTTNYYLNLTASANITSSSGTLSATGLTNPRIYVNGVESSTIVADQWQHITVTTDTPITADQFYLGRSGSNYFDGTIDEVRLYNKPLSSSEVQQLFTWAPGPVGYWKMDEGLGTTIYDTSGNGKTGTLISGPSWNSGKFGNAVGFDNSDDYAEIASPLLPTTDFTYQAWVYPKSVSDETIFYSGSSVDELFINIGEQGAGLVSVYIDETVGSSTNTVSANTWSHITVTRLGSAVNIYINGIKDPSTLTDGDVLNFSSCSLLIGIHSNDTCNATRNFPFNGNIDEAKIYNYARTPSQIIQDMNAGHPLVGTPVGGPVAHYKFDEGYGTTANDSTPNNNHLTLNTASWTNDGRIGKAWNGNGSRWLTRADDPDFDFEGSEDFTISHWIKSDSATNPAAAEMTLSKFETTGSATRGYAITFNTNGTLNFIFDDDNDGTYNGLTTPQDVYDNTWHHIIAVKQNTTSMQLYVDGKQVAQSSSITDTNSLANNGQLVVGDNNGVDSLYEFNGDIDELKIYRAAMTPSDVQAEFNQGKTLVLGALSTESNGTTPSNSSSREYCVPGDTSTCSAPVGEWKLDENTGTSSFDSSGNGYTTTLTGDGLRWQNGRQGSGLFFDGTNDYLYYNDTGSIALDRAGSYSIETWFKLGSVAIDYQTFIMKSNNGVDRENYWLGTYSGASQDELACEHMSAVSATTLTSTTANLTINRWYHAACVFDDAGDTFRMFLDGIPIAQTASTITPNTTNDDLYLGGSNIAAYGDLQGILDQIRIFDYARTPAQVAWNFNHGAPLAWWKFDETSGTTAYDSSQNGNGDANGSTGTLNNTPTRLTTARVSGGIDFDGTDDNISISNNTRIDQNDALAQGLAISFWVYPQTDGETDVGRIFEKNTNTYCRTTGDDGTYVNLECSLDLATDATVTLNDALLLNQWNHVVISWSNDADDEITIYINGKNRTSSSNGVGDASADTATLYIGGNTTNFDGYLDEFKIFNYEPTLNQIQLIMNEGSAVKW